MKNLSKKLGTGVLLMLLGFQISAQDTVLAKESPNSGSQKFLFTGASSAMYAASKDGNTFAPMAFMFMPLVQINNRLLLETGAIMQMDETGGFSFGLEALNLHYKVNDWMSFHIGKFAAPWGNALDMFGEGFVSRFPVAPIGFADDGMAPTDQVGVGVQGGFQVGNSKMLYDLYLANGPQLITDDPDNYGHMSYESFMDNNQSKAVGGKIGLLPFSNSSLQVDAFGQIAPHIGSTGDSTYQDVASTSYGVDMNFVKLAGPVLVRIMGQFEQTTTDKALYGTDTTAFDNTGNTWYVAATLRPSGSSSTFVSNLEFGVRYVTYTPPTVAPWGGDPSTQLTFDLTYWFSWSSQINFGYDIVDDGTTKVNQFVVRTVYKF